ncbi:hypothetical protein C0995_001432 [Termitomyces sp. Mi166|nr:hypothetical protein C0995_001432 [Termitomyces sp. Mi166\
MDRRQLKQRASRQLEAIIRISESLAKMTLSPVVKNHHVEEAIRLFKFSTMDAVSAGSVDGLSRGELNEEMTRIERELKRRLPVGWSTSYQSLVREFVTQQGFSSHALERTLFVMEKREIIRFSGQQLLRFLERDGMCRKEQKQGPPSSIGQSVRLLRTGNCSRHLKAASSTLAGGFGALTRSKTMAMYDQFFNQQMLGYGLDFSSFHSPAELAAPSIDCFENELDQLDLLELEVTQVDNAFTNIAPSIGPPSSITQSSESSAHDTLSFYSEPHTTYSFPLDDMDFTRVCVDDYSTSPLMPSPDDPTSFGPLPPTPPRSPKAFDKTFVSRSSFSDYAPPPSKSSSISSDFYAQFGFTTPTIPQSTISPSHISTPPVIAVSQERGDPRKKYKCPNCPRAFARAYNLKTHMTTHDPNRLKPHVCPHGSCGRSFSRKHDLGRHLVSIHRDEDTSSHRSVSSKVSIGVGKGPRSWCDSCGKGYVGKAPACACRDVK